MTTADPAVGRAATSGPRLARNTAVNLVGFGLPLAVALVTVPYVIAGFGTERFGLLALTWAVVGYFGMFDLGLGQAVVRNLSRALAAGDRARIGAVVGSALALFAALGVLGGLVAWLVVPRLAAGFLNAEGPLLAEAIACGQVLAFAVPLVVLYGGLMGILEAQHKFGLANAVSVPMGTFSFISPLLVLPFSVSLVPVVSLLVLGRLAAIVALLRLALTTTAPARDGLAVERGEIGRLLAFGGWVTVSRVVSPLLGYFDRFLIGSLLPLRALAHYAAPSEIAYRLYVVPTALIRVLLPAITLHAERGDDRVSALFARGMKFTFLAMFPITLCIVLFAEAGLRLWLGAEFAEASTRVLQLLIVGVYVNSFAYTAVTLLQGVGRPDYSAKLQLAELPVFLLVAWQATLAFGIVGAAAVSAARLAADLVAHLWLCGRALGGIDRSAWRVLAAAAAGAAALLGAIFVADGKPAALAAGIAATAAVGWLALLDRPEKTLIAAGIRRLVRRR